MNHADQQVRRLEPADADQVARVFARAFAWHEPWGDWAMPDRSDREERIFNRFRQDLLERFIPDGECWTIDRLTATMWIPPGVESLQSRRSEGDYAAFGDVADAMREGDELIASLKPDVEHWFLDTIATDPDHHGEGLGGRILDHDLAIRDAAGHACALDTHTADNIAFYGRRGFEVIGEGQLRGGPPVFVMFRPPPKGELTPLPSGNTAQAEGADAKRSIPSESNRVRGQTSTTQEKAFNGFTRRQGGDHHGLGPRHRQGDGGALRPGGRQGPHQRHRR